MSGPNHVTGGVVFTGIFCSFWNINIFESPMYIVACGFFSVLPDIDHTKSWIGKLFYPVAKYLDRKYGHRTITHSLLVYVVLFGIISFIEKIYLNTGNVYTLIFAFSYLSHLIFDMLTKQGIPLFYPFRRNPCVIPANPEYRFKSSDFKTEAVLFAVFIILGLSCAPLFANGFWTTYNNQFNTTKHLFREFRSTDRLIEVDYDFSRMAKEYKGKAYLVGCKEDEVWLFNNGFIHITKEDHIKSVSMTKTDSILRVDDLFFINISPDSLQRLLHNKAIISIKIQSDVQFNYVKNNKPSSGTSMEQEFCYNPNILFVDDSINSDLRNRIELLEYELQKEVRLQSQFLENKQAVLDSISFITVSITEMDFYNREKATIQLQKLKSRLSTLKAPEDNSNKIRIQLRQLNEALKNKKEASCSGYISYVVF